MIKVTNLLHILGQQPICSQCRPWAACDSARATLAYPVMRVIDGMND